MQPGRARLVAARHSHRFYSGTRRPRPTPTVIIVSPSRCALSVASVVFCLYFKAGALKLEVRSQTQRARATPFLMNALKAMVMAASGYTAKGWRRILGRESTLHFFIPYTICP